MDSLAAELATILTGGGKIPDRKWLELKGLLQGIIWSARKSFKVKSLEKIDADSVIDLAILRALKVYEESQGRFDYHAMRWIHTLLKREIIRNADVRIPFRIADKDYLIEDEDREDFLGGDMEDALREKYDLSKSEYVYLSHIKQVIGTRVDLTHESPCVDESHDDFDLRTRLEEAINVLPKDDAFIVCHAFGVCGYQLLDEEEIGSKLGLAPSTVRKRKSKAIAKLKLSRSVVDKLGDFYE